MRTRKKKFSDYGITPEEGKKIKEYCIHLDGEKQRLLLETAETAAPGIGTAIYTSLVKGVGYYQLLQDDCDLPASSDDFYAYKRKTIAEFYKKLVKTGDKVVNVRLL